MVPPQRSERQQVLSGTQSLCVAEVEYATFTFGPEMTHNKHLELNLGMSEVDTDV